MFLIACIRALSSLIIASTSSFVRSYMFLPSVSPDSASDFIVWVFIAILLLGIKVKYKNLRH